MYINNQGHMTKMATMPIYMYSKIFFSGIDGLISKYYNVYINHELVMTLTYFTAKST